MIITKSPYKKKKPKNPTNPHPQQQQQNDKCSQPKDKNFQRHELKLPWRHKTALSKLQKSARNAMDGSELSLQKTGHFKP